MGTYLGDANMGKKPQEILDKAKIGLMLRLRLDKLFEKEGPVTSINLLGFDCHRKKLDVTKEDLPALIKVSESIDTLESILMWGISLDDEAADQICEMVKKVVSLKFLCLFADKLGDNGIIKISSTIANHPSLQRIQIYGESIGDKGVGALVGAFKNNRDINKISIAGDKITCQGAQTLFNFVNADTDRFLTVALNCDSLDKDNCESISKFLVSANTLENFFLEANHVETPKVILDGFRENTSLTGVIFIDNSMTECELKNIESELKEITQRNKEALESTTVSKKL